MNMCPSSGLKLEGLEVVMVKERHGEESREQRAGSREQRTGSREQRAESRESRIVSMRVGKN
jgi:hypothetical protein